MTTRSKSNFITMALVATMFIGPAMASDRPLSPKPPTGVSVWTFTNKTGLPDDAVFVQIPSGTLTGVCGGALSAQKCFTTAGGQVYSLKQLRGQVPGAGKSGPVGEVPRLFLDDATAARLNITLGNKTATNNIVQGLVEMTLAGKSASNNLDVSYVNSVGLPLSLAVRKRSDGALYPVARTGLWPTNQVKTGSGATIFKNLIAAVPSSAVTTNNYNAQDNAGNIVGQISGTVAVVSPSTSATGYHDWSTLITSGATVSLGSYTVPTGQPLANVLYGFSTVTPGGSGKLPSSPFNSNPSTLAGPTPTLTDTNNAFLAGQTYSLTATFTSDLNPKGTNTRLTNLGQYSIPAGTAGVKISGYGGAAGAPTASAAGSFDIYITKAQLNAPNGIYGANPWYVVDWTGNGTPSAVATNNTNSLADRVVGDLAATATFGMIGSNTQIGPQMIASKTSANFSDTQWNAKTTTTIGTLTSGQYFYLLALQQSPMQFAQWAGSSVQSSSNAYDVYGNAFQSLTQAYAFAYSDRINSSVALNPDLFYSGGSAPPDIDKIYIDITLQPGGYTFVPTKSPRKH